MIKLLHAQQGRRTVERKVLVIKPSALGDVVMALPAVRNLRRGLPGAKIYWLINKGLAGILDGNPNVDHVIEFDRETLGRMWCSAAAWEEFKSLVKSLRAEKFDAVLDMQGLLRTAILGRLSGCTIRVGMRDAREGAPFLYTDLVARPEGTEHVVDHYCEMAELLWVDGGAPIFEMGVNEVAEATAMGNLGARGVSGDYAVLIPGASDASKRWPVERFAAVADQIAKDYGLKVVATGSKGEAETIAQVARLATTEVVNLAGQTTLPELVAVLRNSRLIVGNDTGPTHIAAALGRPLAVIFGQVNPARLYPYGRKQCVAAIEPWSRPAGIRSDEPRYKVENVTFEMVQDVVREQMKDRKGPTQ
jgi:heptosyltransferase I